MNLGKRLIFILSLGLSAIFLSSFAFSVCSVVPEYIEIYSGSNNLGDFVSGDSVYINSNLHSNPLKFYFYFSNSADGCYVDASAVNLQLFPTGSYSMANEIVTSAQADGSYVSKATFVFDIDLNVTSSFLSTFTVEASDNSVGTGTLRFYPDSSAPIFQTFSYQPSNTLLQSGDTINIDYYVSDSGSGLSTVRVTGGTAQIITFDNGENVYDGEVSEELISTRTYLITAQDKLGHSTSKNVTFNVDSVVPVVDNVRKVYHYDGQRKVTFTVDITDSSYGIIDDFVPTVSGDFSQINPSVTNYVGDCEKVDDTVFECSFENIVISLADTENVIFTISADDAAGNEANQQISSEIFVDEEGPQIIDFYVKNNLGELNIINSLDDDAIVFLRFSDESLQDGDVSIIENFGTVQFAPGPNCEYIGNVGECSWDLGERVDVYSGMASANDTYSIKVVDLYGNYETDKIEVTIDNVAPVISDVEVRETESIEDGVIKSGEEIDFRIFVEDLNLFSNQYHITADFSNIDFRSGMDNVSGSCAQYNSSLVQCDFTGIEVVNGYLKRNVTFYVYDVAGNLGIENFEVEILKVSNEVVSSFRIEDLDIINPLNRNVVLKSGTSAWFEGALELMGEGSDMVLVNYQLKSCNESQMDPLIAPDFSLYPDDVVVNYGQDGAEEFAMEIELKAHTNVNDLNTKTMTCVMAVLKRDAENLYPAELVEFKVNFGFYDTPGGDYTKRYASEILSDIEDIEWTMGWFQTIYDIYDLFNSLCTVVNTGGSLMNTGVELWSLLQKATTAGCITTGVGTKGESCFITPMTATEGSKLAFMNFLTEPPVKTICDFVTCRNGFWLGDLFESGAWDKENYDSNGNYNNAGHDIPGLSDTMDFLKGVQYDLGAGLCAGDWGNLFGSKGDKAK